MWFSVVAAVMGHHQEFWQLTTPQWKETNYKHVDEIAIAATAETRNVLEFLVVLDSLPCHVWVCGVRVACWDCSRASAALCDPHRHHPQPPSSSSSSSWSSSSSSSSSLSSSSNKLGSRTSPCFSTIALWSQRHAPTVGHLPKAFRASVKLFISYTCA